MDYFLITLLVLHLIYAFIIHRKLLNSKMLGSKQRKINLVLIWLFPFIWSFIIHQITKEDNKVMTKDDRKLEPGSNSDNWFKLTGGDINGTSF